MSILRIAPSMLAYPDENHENLIIEIELPGVKKEDIKFKMHDDSFYVTATKEGIEYNGSYATCCPIKPDKAEGKYENGLLIVTVPYKDPLEDAVEVKIN